MSLEDVEKKVMASAQAEAKGILEKAEAEAKAQRERREASLRDEQARKIRAGKAGADAAYEREVSSRRAQHGMQILQAKNEVLDAVFEAARARILASQDIDYGAWLTQQVRLAVEHGQGVLHCNQRDRETVEGVLRDTGAGTVTLAPENASMQGGVLLVGESFDLDLTLESALTDLRDEMTVSLAERLFADVPTLGTAPAGEAPSTEPEGQNHAE